MNELQCLQCMASGNTDKLFIFERYIKPTPDSNGNVEITSYIPAGYFPFVAYADNGWPEIVMIRRNDSGNRWYIRAYDANGDMLAVQKGKMDSIVVIYMKYPTDFTP